MANIVIKVKKEKQQINFLNCDKINEWKDTCQYRYGEYVDAVYYIKYTTTNEEKLVPYTTNGWGANYIDSVYQDGIGYLLFDKEPTTIPNDAFRGGSTLKTLDVGTNITSIGSNAFYGCNGIEEIYAFSTTAPSVNNDTFYNIKYNGTLYYPQGSDYSNWMGDNVPPIVYIESYEGDWNVEINSPTRIENFVFTSNKINDNETTIERVYFDADKDCVLVFNVDQSSEKNFDYLIVGKVDSGVVDNTGATYCSFHTKGLDGTKSYDVQVPSGNHYIEMMYRKDVSQSTGRDNVIVTISATNSTTSYKLSDYNWTSDYLQILDERDIYGEVYCGENATEMKDKMHQVTYDNINWITVSTTPTIVSSYSYNCGYRTQYITGDTYCKPDYKEGITPYCKVAEETRQISYDYGVTWIDDWKGLHYNDIETVDYNHYYDTGEINKWKHQEQISLDCIPEYKVITIDFDYPDFPHIDESIEYEFENGEIPSDSIITDYRTMYMGRGISEIREYGIIGHINVLFILNPEIYFYERALYYCNDLNVIKYCSTKEEWKYKWNIYEVLPRRRVIVVCTDGTITYRDGRIDKEDDVILD